MQRRELAVARLDASAHLRERLHHSLHRPAGERFVAENARGERLSRENSRQHADGRTGVPRVEIAGRRAQSVEPFAMDDELRARALHFDSQGAHAPEGRVAIRPGGIVGDAGVALGNRADQGVTVRDGLVAGQRKTARNDLGR